MAPGKDSGALSSQSSHAPTPSASPSASESGRFPSQLLSALSQISGAPG